MEINFNFLFQYLEKNNIVIDKSEFIFQIESHPNYPSLLAISDTLSFFKINNLVTKLERENIEHLPETFIGLINENKSAPSLTFIEQKDNSFQFSQNKKKVVLTIEEFKERFENIVLLAEKDEEQSGQPINNFIFYKTIFFGILYLTTILLFDCSFINILFSTLTCLGVYLSIEAISHEFGVKTKFSEKVCRITTNSDCDAVINAKKSKLLELINFNDASITFFTAQLFSLLLFSFSNRLDDFYNITTIVMIPSIGITFFSLYQQIIVTKKWCPICLSIISLIYFEIACCLFLNRFTFLIDIKSILIFSLILIASYTGSIFIKRTIKKKLELESEVIKGNRFKRNYSLFKMSLLASEKVDSNFVCHNKIVLGNPNSNLKIVLVSSLFCGYCKDLHTIIENILDRYKDIVCIDFHFHFNAEKNNEKSKLIHQKLIQIYYNDGQVEFIKQLRNWFENRDETKLICNSFDVNNDEIDLLLKNQFQWNQENDLNFTPAILINGYRFPKEYERSDLIHFINDLFDDETTT
jgi:hypothetical protein